MHFNRKGKSFINQIILQDIFTTLVDIKWRWTIFVFALNFILSWLIFAVLWYLIAYSHGDFDWIHNIRDSELSSTVVGSANKTEKYIPCVTELYGFTSTFLFSLESQHTIGKKILFIMDMRFRSHSLLY